jgi:hypothetical protein
VPTKGEMEVKFIDFELLLKEDASFWALPLAEQAKVVGVSKPTLFSWRKKVDWEVVRKCREAQRHERICEANESLRRRTVEGNMEAVLVTYARYDQWHMKQVSEVSVGAQTPETQADTRDLLLATLCAMSLDEVTGTLEALFQSFQPDDRRHVLERLAAVPAEVLSFDVEKMQLKALPQDVQRLVSSQPFGGEQDHLEKLPADWGDYARATQ